MPQARDRVAVIEVAYHQRVGQVPFQVETRWSRECLTQEQSYQRDGKVGEKWEPLNAGWIEECGLIVIQNKEGSSWTVNPTDEERAEVEKKVLELGYVGSQEPCHHCWLILPQESFRGYPVSLYDLRIRCRSGTARFTLTAFPA